MAEQLDLTGEDNECQHEIIDEYSDGAKGCELCGKDLSPVVGMMLKHLGIISAEE